MIKMNEEKYEQLRLENQLCFPLYACARMVVNRYTPFLKPLGLTYTQYIVFMALWDTDGMTVGDIGKRLYLDVGTLSPVLKKLETEGYIQRTRFKLDERVVLITLTKKGWDMREKVKDIPACVAKTCNLTQQELESVYGILYKMLDGGE
jgi:DNA-binding MarR family transcriptional regulator